MVPYGFRKLFQTSEAIYVSLKVRQMPQHSESSGSWSLELIYSYSKHMIFPLPDSFLSTWEKLSHLYMYIYIISIISFYFDIQFSYLPRWKVTLVYWPVITESSKCISNLKYYLLIQSYKLLDELLYHSLLLAWRGLYLKVRLKRKQNSQIKFVFFCQFLINE